MSGGFAAVHGGVFVVLVFLVFGGDLSEGNLAAAHLKLAAVVISQLAAAEVFHHVSAAGVAAASGEAAFVGIRACILGDALGLFVLFRLATRSNLNGRGGEMVHMGFDAKELQHHVLVADELLLRLVIIRRRSGAVKVSLVNGTGDLVTTRFQYPDLFVRPFVDLFRVLNQTNVPSQQEMITAALVAAKDSHALVSVAPRGWSQQRNPTRVGGMAIGTTLVLGLASYSLQSAQEQLSALLLAALVALDSAVVAVAIQYAKAAHDGRGRMLR